MSQFSSETTDRMRLAQAHLTGLCLARTLDELAHQTQTALAALLPDTNVQTRWLAALNAATMPDAATLERLRAGDTVPAEAGTAALVPLHAAGELLGFFHLSPPLANPEQGLWLNLLALVLGPSYLALRSAIANRHAGDPLPADDRHEALADPALLAPANAATFASESEALARRVQELERANTRLYKLLRTANALRAERQLDDLLPQIATIVSNNSGFQSAIVALVRREHTVVPYLQRVAAAGLTPPTLDPLRPARMPLTRFEALLRPAFAQGSLTYLLAQGADEYRHLWDRPATVVEPSPTSSEPEHWQPGTALFCLLRNSRGELLGLLGLDDPEDGLRLKAAQVPMLELLANQAAAAIENAYLHADQQLSLNRMLALNGLGRAISTTLRSPQQIYELTARGIQDMSEARWATVYLYNQRTGELSTPIHTGAPPLDLVAAAQLARETITARRPVSRLPDATGIGEALIGIPLRGSRQMLGALCIGYREGTPSTAELETLILFASQAATAVESLHLLAAVREGRDQLASIMTSTREGLLLVSDTAQIAVANEAFLSLADGTLWPAALVNSAALTDLPVSQLRERWQAVANFAPGEFEQLWTSMHTVADGRELFTRGQLNGAAPGARSLEWTVLRATREATNALPTADSLTGPQWPILLTIRDITAAKATERLRNDLTNMMIHDLRSPLTSIMTSIDMLFRGITGEVATTQREILTIAYTSAQHLLNMVNLLLDISRLEGGHMPLDRTDLAVERLIERAANRMRVIARNKLVTLEVAVAPEAAYVYADMELVLRVLQNLLDNALKFSAKNGSIRLTADDVPTSTAATPEGGVVRQMVRFAVHDSGMGIRPSDLDKIFHKFGQAGNRRNAGSGLGLTFCKLVVEAHGGQIWVESTFGAGSTFAFTLPAAAFEEEG